MSRAEEVLNKFNKINESNTSWKNEDRITKTELEKKLISIELLISSIDSDNGDRRKGLKTMLIQIADRL